MQFVHLAPRSAISRIRRDGLYMGRGRHGRGLYCVPLTGVARTSWLDNIPAHCVFSGRPVSTLSLWKWLLRDSRNRRSRPVAVVFDAPSSAWPAHLHLGVPDDIAMDCHRLLKKSESEGFRLERPDGRPDWLYLNQRPLNGTVLISFDLRVECPRGLGAILRDLRQSGFRTHSRISDGMELVFPCATGTKHIRRLVTLDRSSHREPSARDARGPLTWAARSEP
jgi:hypothetical protein